MNNAGSIKSVSAYQSTNNNKKNHKKGTTTPKASFGVAGIVFLSNKTCTF
jgi:hypothetical protein